MEFNWSQWIPILLPLVLLELALLIGALWDLAHRERVRGGNKWIWLAVIVLISAFGPLAYLLFGRED